MKFYLLIYIFLCSTLFTEESNLSNDYETFELQQKKTSIWQKTTLSCYYSYKWLEGGIQLPFLLWNILDLPKKKVSFLGGSKISKDSFYYSKAKELASLCIKKNIGILHGGGGGIMHAVDEATATFPHFYSCNLGIFVKGFKKPEFKKTQKVLQIANFEMRQWALISFPDAIVIFPGGVGTLFELFQLLTLKDIDTLNEELIIILFGKEYWNPLISFIKRVSLERGLIDKKVLTSFVMTDSTEESINLILKACEDVDEIQYNVKNQSN